MATNTYFEEEIFDQKRDISMVVKFGRSSFYSNCPLPDGSIGEDSIYLEVDEKSVVMSLEMAEKLVQAMAQVGSYFDLR